MYLRENVVTSNISSSLVRERGKNYEHAKLVALVPEVVWDRARLACPPLPAKRGEGWGEGPN
ncbi:MAG: hypothetical protein Q8L48_00010 [Archangium sp.]|nr:hypothetical protein [Archangium sp.]